MASSKATPATRNVCGSSSRFTMPGAARARATTGIRRRASSRPRKPRRRHLGPVIDALAWWGLRHAWRWPQAGEPLHAEHLLRAAIQAIDLGTDDHPPARWHFRLDVTDYLAECDGQHWSLTAGAPAGPADVTVTATAQALTALIFAGSDRGLDIAGESGPVRRFRQLIGTMATVAQPA